MDNVTSILERIQARRLTLTSSSGRELEEPEYQCSHCYDRGIIVGEDGMARICRCQKQKRLERLFKSSQITPAFRAKTFENFVTAGRPPAVRAMYECAKDYAKRFHELRDRENNWLAFLGQPGSGKTHLLVAIANSLLGADWPVLYFQHVEGFTELREALRESGEGSAAAKIAETKRSPILLWDDLFKGREMSTPWVLEVVFEIVNYRYLNCLPTLFSSERLPQELLKLDEAAGSRILERAKGRTVVITEREANYRLR